MPHREKTQVFGRNASLLLDVLRFAAALVVALSHMAHRFVDARGFLSERAGNAAVCVFFVLSGFVIRYISVARVGTGREYVVDRVSRIYSVVLPALVLTLLLEGAAYLHAPVLYRTFSDPFAWSIVPTEIVQNLTFTVGWWGHGSPPLSNGPFWSLSFECVYYALYGLLQYAPRARWVSVPLLLLLVGPSIALLFPIWLLGAALYDLYAWLQGRSRGIAEATGGLFVYLGFLLLIHRPLLRFLQATTVGQRTAALTHLVLAYPWGRSLYGGGNVPWLNRLSLSYYITGSLLAVALLPALLALDRYARTPSRVWAGRVRLVADSTFTLYLFHLPFFIFVVTMAGGPWKSWGGGLLMLAAAVGLSIPLARSFDRLKHRLRQQLRRGPRELSRAR